MNSVQDIFDAVGGTKGVARILGVAYNTASEMRRRRSIPIRWWPTLLASAEADKAGLTQGVLVRIQVARHSNITRKAVQ